MKISIIVLSYVLIVLPLSANATEIDSAKIYYKKGYNEAKINKYPEALRSYYKAYLAYQADGNSVKEAQLANHLGATFYKLLQYQNAIEYYQKALVIRKELNLTSKIADTEFNLGETYFMLGKNLKAGDHLLNALYEYEKLEDKENIADVYHQFGIMQQSIDQIDAAAEMYYKELDNTKNNLRKGRAYNELGFIVDSTLKIEAYQNALFYAKKAFDSTVISMAYNNIAGLHKGDEAISYYLVAEPYLNDQEYANPALYNTYLKLSQLYEAEGAYKKAITYSRKYEDVSEQLREKQAQAERDKLFYEGQVALLELKSFDTHRKQKEKEKIYYAITGVLSFLTAIGFVLWRYQRHRRLKMIEKLEMIISNP